MTGLDEDDREVLAEYKASLVPDAGDVRDNWEQIVGRLEPQPAGPDVRSRAVWFGLGAVAAMATLLLGMTVFVGNGGDDDAPAFQSVDRSVRSSPSLAPVRGDRVDAPDSGRAGVRVSEAGDGETVASLEPSPEPPPIQEPRAVSVVSDGPEASETLRPRRPARPRRSSETRDGPKSDSQAPGMDIKAELALLRQARAALAGDDHGRVLSLVRRYERDFSSGSMKEEIDLLRVHALCAGGPKDAWRAAKSRFERSYPTSPLRAQLRDDCVP